MATADYGTSAGGWECRLSPGAFWRDPIVRIVLVVASGALALIAILFASGEWSGRDLRMNVAFVLVMSFPFLLRGWVESRATIQVSPGGISYRSFFTHLTFVRDDIASVRVTGEGSHDPPSVGYVEIRLNRFLRTNPLFLSHASTRGVGIPGLLGRTHRFPIENPNELVAAYDRAVP